jgi:hypothetical protein
MNISVDDQTGEFSKQDHAELITLVEKELLSNDWDRNLLAAIIIRDDGPNREYGFYAVQFQCDGLGNITLGVAAIVLNQYYLKSLAQLKRTLAHEYGHHWTISYLAVNQGITREQRLPYEYYTLRNMNKIQYAHDYRMGWDKCDREVIAEDYRVLFAPSPYDEDHRIVRYNPSLSFPDNRVKEYIFNLQNPER